MGMKSVLYGYIEEASADVGCDASDRSNQNLIAVHNQAIISTLPEIDEWPPLPRSIFSMPPPNAPMVCYRNRPIHFAAILKEVDWEMAAWLDKFEALLHKLHWESALVHLSGAYIGPHAFEWRVASESFTQDDQGRLDQPKIWRFNTTLKDVDLIGQRAVDAGLLDSSLNYSHEP